MKTKHLVTIITLSLLTVSTFAQQPESQFSFELNAGPSLANNDLGGADLSLGAGFEVIFHYQFMPHLGAYTGWGWNHFSADQSFAGDDMDFEETGYVFGLQFIHPLGASPVSGYLRIGGLFNHIEIENNDGEIVHDTGHGLGVQFAGGIDIPMGAKWSFIPGIKFNALSRELETGDTTTKLNLNYDCARIGFVRKF